jgi:hypothetical protein
MALVICLGRENPFSRRFRVRDTMLYNIAGTNFGSATSAVNNLVALMSFGGMTNT